jgi:hypothetical protein
MNNSDKTIPYKLTPAELENLRLLRKRMNPSGSIPDDDAEEKSPGEIEARISDLSEFALKTENKNS